MDRPTNNDDVIDSRDVIAAIEELEAELEEIPSEEQDKDNVEELQHLKELAKQGEASPDWSYGETLIRDSYFEDYAQELAKDCGMIQEGSQWPNYCIDWEWAARELRQDYISVDFGEVQYWIRA